MLLKTPFANAEMPEERLASTGAYMKKKINDEDGNTGRKSKSGGLPTFMMPMWVVQKEHSRVPPKRQLKMHVRKQGLFPKKKDTKKRVKNPPAHGRMQNIISQENVSNIQ